MSKWRSRHRSEMMHQGDSSVPVMHMVSMPGFIRYSTRLFLVLLLLGAIGLLLLPWQQTSVGQGEVIAYSPQEREQTIDAPIKGRVVRWHVQEGERVKEGQLLVEIAENDENWVDRLKVQRNAAYLKESSTQMTLKAIEEQHKSIQEVRELELEAMDAKIKMTRYELESERQGLKSAQGELRAAKLNAERYEIMSAKGLASQRDQEKTQAEEAKAQAKMLSAKAKIEQYQSKLLSLKAEKMAKASDMTAKLSELEAKMQAQRAKIAEASSSTAKAEGYLASYDQSQIRAPRDGIVYEIFAQEGGDFIKAGEQLALLIPDVTQFAAEVYVSGNDVPLIVPGRHVRLQFEGWPAVQFSGWPSVAVGTFGGRVDFVDARAEVDGKFRIVVVPDPNDRPWPESYLLRQGMKTNAWVMLDEVTLGYELWRQLNGFPPTTTEDMQKKGDKGEKKKKK